MKFEHLEPDQKVAVARIENKVQMYQVDYSRPLRNVHCALIVIADLFGT
jgi:hypothetical protein